VRLPKVWIVRGLLAASVCVVAAGCDEKLSDVTGPTPNLEPTFASVSSLIITQPDSAGRTACVTCHTNVGRAPAGNLNMAGDAYAAMVNVPSRQQAGETLIIPGDPANSYLIKKLKGVGITGLRMPRNGPPFLTDGQILVIERWIQLGARNN
jgi:hypothetical protein